MRKILVFLVMFGVLLGSLGFVVGVDEDQPVNLEVGEVIDISVDSLEYGTIVPGDTATDDSVITVNEPNNVDLAVTVSITDAGAGDIFNDIMFDLTAFVQAAVVRIGDGPQSIDVDDGSVVTIHTNLLVAVGTPAGAKVGTINYVAMKRV